ncbi:unnamed protein product [Ectocarpus fasciculatus]
MEANPTVQAVTSERLGSLPKRSRKKSSRSSQQVLMCIADCKYDVVRAAAQAKGWKLVNEDPEASSTRKCHVYWIDVPAIVERMQHLHRWQRINHFPGMSNVARKGRLAQNLDRMRRTFPQEYSFYPRTWVLPVEWGAFKTEFDASGKSTRTFIVKPDSGCQGRGIFLTQDLERVEATESQVAQLYVQRPLLIEGFKFDLRLYVLVTSVIPLRVYAFKDGLTRFCTEEYSRASSDNLGRRCMHLTNYAVNKGSDNFVANDQADLGSKRSLRWLLGWIAAERGGQEKADALWRKMGGAITKTLVSVLPTLHREYLHTFGHDKGVHRPAATSATNTTANIASNTSDANTSASTSNVARSDSNSGHVRLPLGKVGAENTGSSSCDSDSCRTGDSIRDGNPVCQISGSEQQPPRQRREGESTFVFSSEAPGKDKTLEAVESTSPRSSMGAAGASGVVEEDSEGSGSGTQPGIAEGGERCGEKQAQSYDISVDGDGKTVTGASDRRRRHADGEKGEGKTAGDSEGVVEGSRCVEILGFDFMIDAALKPWLIEVNHLPSFATDSPLDRHIKAQVVSAALSVLHAKADDRKRYEETVKRDAQNRLYNPDASAAGTAQKEKERKEAEAAVAKIRRKLEAIYMRFAPHKLGKVDRLLVKYAGDEDKLLRIVRRKYVDTGENENIVVHYTATSAAAAAAAAEGPGSVPVSSGDSGIDGQQAVDHQPAPSASSPTWADTAPVHGGETIPLGEAARNGHRSRQALVKSKANPTEGQTSAWEERLGDGTKPKQGDVHSKTCPPDARILDPPRDPGGGIPGREEGPAPASSSCSWAVQVGTSAHDSEALARETEILEGWERLHPPPEAPAPAPAPAPAEEDYVVGPTKPSPPPPAVKSNDGNGDVNGDSSSTVNDDAGQEESGNGGDGSGGGGGGGGGGGVRNACSGGGKEGTVKGGRRRRKPAATVESMIQRAFEDDRKMTLRLKCPLQQQRGGAMDPQPTTRLPQMGAQPTAAAAATAAAASTTVTSDRQNNRPSPSVVLGPEQREKAQRLMEGYSSNSRRSLSAPSGTTPSSTATPPEEERSTLPVSLRIAVGRAKEWRRRRDEGNARRNTRSVAVRMHTFDFGGVMAPEEGVSKTT